MTQEYQILRDKFIIQLETSPLNMTIQYLIHLDKSSRQQVRLIAHTVVTELPKRHPAILYTQITFLSLPQCITVRLFDQVQHIQRCEAIPSLTASFMSSLFYYSFVLGDVDFKSTPCALISNQDVGQPCKKVRSV